MQTLFSQFICKIYLYFQSYKYVSLVQLFATGLSEHCWGVLIERLGSQPIFQNMKSCNSLTLVKSVDGISVTSLINNSVPNKGSDRVRFKI